MGGVYWWCIVEKLGFVLKIESESERVRVGKIFLILIFSFYYVNLDVLINDVDVRFWYGLNLWMWFGCVWDVVVVELVEFNDKVLCCFKVDICCILFEVCRWREKFGKVSWFLNLVGDYVIEILRLGLYDLWLV